MSKKEILFFRNSQKPGTLLDDSILMDGLNDFGKDKYKEVFYSDVMVVLNYKKTQCFYYHSGKINLLNPDLIYLRGLGDSDTRQFLAKYCKANGVKILNSENLYNMPTSKLNQYYVFSQNNIPYPTTVCAYPSRFTEAIKYLDTKFPIIVKSVAGKAGLDNYRVNSLKELEKLAKSADPVQMFALQPFIENDGDYRIIVYKSKVLICYKRIRNNLQEDHRNNVGQGGSRVLVKDLSKHHKRTAVKVAKVLRRELTGVDLLIGPDKKPYFLESNFKFGMKDTGDEIFELVVKKLAPILHKLAK